MGAYTDLRGAGVSTRRAAALSGVPRSSTTAKKTPPPLLGPPTKPVVANKLSPAERARVLGVLNSPEFVDHTPLQVYAALLEQGVYLCSVSTMYRILRENDLVRERRRQARHPARKVPELVATAPGQVYTWDILCRRRHKISYADLRTMPMSGCRGEERWVSTEGNVSIVR